MATDLQVTTDVPVVLFPVRLETRFVTEGSSRELWIRVYPDDITVTTHESGLTSEEQQDAENFWEIYHGEHSQETIDSAWDQLVGAYGMPRSTFIVRQTEPSINLDGGLNFPAVPGKFGDADWTQAPQAKLLPTRWRAVGIQGGNRVFTSAAANAITASSLAAGPSPNDPDILDPTSSAFWLTNFGEAHSAGMALKIREADHASWNYDAEIDLVVVGIREDSNATASASAMGQHFKDRFYEDDFSFLPVGAPTNHTEGKRVFDAPEARERYFEVATQGPEGFDTSLQNKHTKARRVARMLGLDDTAAYATHPMADAVGGTDRESDDVAIVQQLLWPGSWGYFLEHILQLDRRVSGYYVDPNSPTGGETYWQRPGFEEMTDLYCRYVRPDGPLSSIRVGDQPYGVLPATTMAGWSEYNYPGDAELQARPIGPSTPGGGGATVLNPLINFYNDQFSDYRLSNAPHLSKNETNIDYHPHKNFIEILQQGPLPAAMSLRGLISQTAYQELVQTMDWSTASPDPLQEAANQEQDRETELSNLGLFNNLNFRPEANYPNDPVNLEPRLARMMPQCVAREDFSPYIIEAPQEVQQNDPFLFPNYLSRLADLPYQDIIDDTDGWMSLADAGEPMPLLALMARHSALQMLYTTALRFLTNWGVSNVSDFEHDIYAPSSEGSESIWDWLNDSISTITNGQVSSTTTLLEFLERLRTEPIALAQDSELGGLFSYEDAHPYIRFWLHLFLFASAPPDGLQDTQGANVREKLEGESIWNYGRKLHTDLVSLSGHDHVFPLEVPYAYDMSNLDPERAERYVLSALGTASDRLDAWVTALATQRLDYMQGDGAGYGGFGYLEGLAPSTSAISSGYVHAPSIEQAHTAAVLKSAHLTYEVEEDVTDNAAAIDLSSARVRQAQQLLQGLRQGQTLGALLGYKLERALRERSNASSQPVRFIGPLREAYPTRVTQITTGGSQTPAGREVVDGLKVIRDDNLSLSSLDSQATQGELTAANAEIDRLRELIDATEDLLLAESVHQITQGNPERALGSLNALNRAGLPPDQFDVVDTPRTGRSVTHRVIILIDASTSPTGATSARAKVAPRLNDWLEGVLGLRSGQAATVSCQITYTTTDQTEVAYYVTLDSILNSGEFNVDPIDLLYMEPASDTGQQGVLDAYVRRIVAQNTGVSWPSRDVSVPVSIDYATPDTGHRSFEVFFDAISTVKDVVASSRVLTGQDLDQPSREVSPTLNSGSELGPSLNNTLAALDDTSGLRADLDNALAIGSPSTTLAPYTDLIGVSTDADLSGYTSFSKLPKSADLAALSSALDLPSATDVETVRLLLFEASEYGITNAAPLSASATETDDRATLVKQACVAYRGIERRVDALPETSVNTATESIERAKTLFGDDFQPLPYIDAQQAEYNHTETYEALKASGTLLGASPEAAFGWLGQVARTRSRVASLQDAFTLVDMIAPESTMSTSQGLDPLGVAQLPLDAASTWIGISKPDQARNAISYLVVDTDGVVSSLDPNSVDPIELTGLVIDEWNEVVPEPHETSGVAFHFDRPATRAPQSILVATPPQVDATVQWTDEMLVDIVTDTMRLAKTRAVDPAQLVDTSLGLLPALVFPDYGDVTPPSVHVDFSSYL